MAAPRASPAKDGPALIPVPRTGLYPSAHAFWNNPPKRRMSHEFYSEHGIQRFIHIGWGYAKGSTSASMIGYLQNMEPEKVLSEVNAHATARKLPSLRRAAATWGARNVTELSQPPLSRPFEPTQIELNHLWIDLRHCRFDLPSDQRPQSAAPPKPVAKKATKRKSPKKGSL